MTFLNLQAHHEDSLTLGLLWVLWSWR